MPTCVSRDHDGKHPTAVSDQYYISVQWVEGQCQTSHRCVYIKVSSLADRARAAFVSSLPLAVSLCEISKVQVNEF